MIVVIMLFVSVENCNAAEKCKKSLKLKLAGASVCIWELPLSTKSVLATEVKAELLVFLHT